MSNLVELFERHTKLSTEKRLNGMSDSYSKFLGYHVREFSKKYSIANRENLSQYVAELKGEASTKNTLVKGMGKFFLWNNLIDSQGYDILKKSFRAPMNDWSKVHLTKDVVDKFIYEAYHKQEMLTSKRDTMALMMLCSIGLRLSQLIELNLSDIKLTGQQMEVTIRKKKQIQRKIEDIKSVKIMSLDTRYNGIYTAQVIVDYLRTRQDVPPKEPALFISKEGTRLSHDYIYKMITRIAERLGVEGITPHSFRHYVGNTAANSKGILYAARLLDHTNITITMKYVTDGAEGVQGI